MSVAFYLTAASIRCAPHRDSTRRPLVQHPSTGHGNPRGRFYFLQKGTFYVSPNNSSTLLEGTILCLRDPKQAFNTNLFLHNLCTFFGQSWTTMGHV